GPDTHLPDVAVKPSADEIARARQYQEVRAAMLDLAKKHVASAYPKATIVVDQITQNAGEVWRGDPARFVFKVKNTGGAPLEITAKPGCGCTVAEYDKVIDPGKEGTIRAEMHTQSYRGIMQKSISVFSND